MEKSITPDRFVLLRRGGKLGILSGLYGGKFGGDEWRRSTHIVSVEKSPDEEGLYFAKVRSGSEYALSLSKVGFIPITEDIWFRISSVYRDIELLAGDDAREAIKNF